MIVALDWEEISSILIQHVEKELINLPIKPSGVRMMVNYTSVDNPQNTIIELETIDIETK